MNNQIKVKLNKVTNKQTIGTGGIGYLTASYQDIVQRLGEPHDRRQEGVWESRDNKIKVEWALKLDKDTVFTIYDYKSKLDPEQNTDWHIGGKKNSAKIKKYLISEFGREVVEIKTK